MTNDSTAPATKEDVGMIMEHLVRMETRMEVIEGTMATVATKEYVDASAAETRRYFDVVTENLRYDLIHGALHDKVQQHEDRIQRLERKAAMR